MSPSDDVDRAAFVRHWRRVGPLLEKIRNDELRALSDSARRDAVDRVLGLREFSSGCRPTSGLVEMQRLFMKWWG